MPRQRRSLRKLALDLSGAVRAPTWVIRISAFHPDLRDPLGGGRRLRHLDADAKAAKRLYRRAAEVFQPVPGGWGRKGYTLVRLSIVDAAVLRGALTTAYRNVEAKQAGKRKKASTRDAR